jgi:hypothetical protein
MALIVSACGRQVTPNPPGYNTTSGLPSGFMSVKFRVAQPFAFSTYSYVIVLNTAGNGATPRAQGASNNYLGYSFAIVVSGAGGTASAQAVQYYRPAGYPANAPPQYLALPTTPQQLVFNPNSNGLGTEFTVTFQRTIVAGISTPAPGPSSSATASPTASPTATTSPTASSSPVAGTCAGVPTATTTWCFNFFVAQNVGPSGQPYGQIVDSLGAGGPSDTTYTSPALDTTSAFDTTFQTMAGNHPTDNGADNITGGEIANNP